MAGRTIPAVVLLLLACFSSDALMAGAAKVDMTPPLGTPLNGYGYRVGRGATEIHDPVWVRCLYLETETTKLLLVTSDLCVINRELRDRVLQLAPAAIPQENIILTATHNHSAQGGMSRAIAARFVSGRFMPSMLDFTASKFAESMRAAIAASKRATVGFGVGTQIALSKNRRHDGGPIDPQIGVIRVDDSDGNPIAIVTNFAAHATTISEKYGLAVSADFPGYYYSALEEMVGPGCIAMFMNGAEGNQECMNPGALRDWAHAESIGKKLAAAAKKISDDVFCGKMDLTVRYSEPQLPLTIADSVMPATTVLQTLEIDDLLITFFPGEPCVEIGLELRRRALARGYRAQFSVGLSNDHLMYFVPTEFYGHPHYEAGMNFYGPEIDDWFYDQFSLLMTSGEHVPAEYAKTGVTGSAIGGGAFVRVTGSAYERGQQRGAFLRREILEAYDRNVLARVRNGSAIPESGLWAVAPGFVDRTPLALPRMAIGARTLLGDVSPDARDEILGMADAGRLPFDAMWLLQCSPDFFVSEQLENLYRAPFCTMFAATGSRAGSSGVLVGRVLDWETDELPVVIEARPDSGRAYVQVGFPWNAGVFTGMNDARLVVCAERVEDLGGPSFDAPPIEFVLRDILQYETTMQGAVQRIQSLTRLRGYHVLIADGGADDAVVLELGESLSARRPVGGLLLGAEADSRRIDEDARKRYTRVRQLLDGRASISVDAAEAIVSDSVGPEAGRARIFNVSSRHGVVFEPKARTVHVAFPGPNGKLGAFDSIHLDHE